MNYELELRRLLLLAKACRAAQKAHSDHRTQGKLVIAKAAEKQLDAALLRIAIALEAEERAEEIKLLE